MGLGRIALQKPCCRARGEVVMSVIKENKEGHLRPTYSAATCKTPNAHSGCEKRPFSPSDVSSIVKTPSYTHDSSLRRYISFVITAVLNKSRCSSRLSSFHHTRDNRKAKLSSSPAATPSSTGVPRAREASAMKTK